MEDIKITKITATGAWDPMNDYVKEFVYGLGEDNKIYYWDYINGFWTLWHKAR